MERDRDRWTETEKQSEPHRAEEGSGGREAEGGGAGHTQTPAGGDRSEQQGHVRPKQHRGSLQHPGAAPGCGPGPCSAPEPLSPRSCGLGHLASLDNPRSRLRPEPHCGALESELRPLACLFRALSPPRLSHISPPRTHILARLRSGAHRVLLKWLRTWTCGLRSPARAFPRSPHGGSVTEGMRTAHLPVT